MSFDNNNHDLVMTSRDQRCSLETTEQVGALADNASRKLRISEAHNHRLPVCKVPASLVAMRKAKHVAGLNASTARDLTDDRASISKVTTGLTSNSNSKRKPTLQSWAVFVGADVL